MRTAYKVIVIVVIIIAVLVIGFLALVGLGMQQSQREARALQAVIDCIDLYGGSLICMQICEGTASDPAYENDLRLINKENCRPFINEAVRSLNL